MFRTHKNKTEEQDKTNMDKIKAVITGEGYIGVQCTILALFWKADISQKVKLVKKNQVMFKCFYALGQHL